MVSTQKSVDYDKFTALQNALHDVCMAHNQAVFDDDSRMQKLIYEEGRGDSESIKFLQSSIEKRREEDGENIGL